MVAARDALRLPRLYARAAAKDTVVRDIGLRGRFAGAATKRGTTMRRWNNQINGPAPRGAVCGVRRNGQRTRCGLLVCFCAPCDGAQPRRLLLLRPLGAALAWSPSSGA